MTTGFDMKLTIDVEIEYKLLSAGYPETKPTASCAGEPGAGPDFKFSVMMNGRDITEALGLTTAQEELIRDRILDDYYDR